MRRENGEVAMRQVTFSYAHGMLGFRNGLTRTCR